jgi:hypothetical protein
MNINHMFISFISIRGGDEKAHGCLCVKDFSNYKMSKKQEVVQ